MAFHRGDRFYVNLSSGVEEHAQNQNPSTSIETTFIRDIVERPPGNFNHRTPLPPSGALPHNGFPLHKKRIATRSRYERSNDVPVKTAGMRTASPASISTLRGDNDFRISDRRGIDQENKEKLVRMSNTRIEHEREELMRGLPTSLVERLLKRATIDDPPAEYKPMPGARHAFNPNTDQSFANATGTTTQTSQGQVSFREPEVPKSDDGEHVERELKPSVRVPTNSSATHFPQPLQTPSLDPNSISFMADLHEKYFPDLSLDPSKLAWMSFPSASERESYSTSLDSLPVSALRFSFAGAILPPSVSASLPVTKGLHHHGDSPAAAGYTLGELAHLARSSFPSQRCIAFQTFGRILYRLGCGEFGAGNEGQDMERGIWACVKEGRVLESLQEEAGKKHGHVSAQAFAVDALWLWQQGGGRTEPEQLSAS